MIKHTDEDFTSFYKATRVSLLLGFGLSLLLTCTAFYLYTLESLQTHTKIFSILTLAIFQLGVQLFFFLHLFEEKRPRWNLLSFLFMALVVVIIGFGSLWIMNDLNHRTMMSEQEMHQYMLDQEAIHKHVKS